MSKETETNDHFLERYSSLNDFYSVSLPPFMIYRILVGFGTNFFRTASLLVSGVAQSLISKPPVLKES